MLDKLVKKIKCAVFVQLKNLTRAFETFITNIKKSWYNFTVYKFIIKFIESYFFKLLKLVISPSKGATISREDLILFKLLI